MWLREEVTMARQARAFETATCLLALVLLLPVLSGCSEARRTMRESRSPNGTLIARVIEINPGPTVGFKYEVEISESSSQARRAVFRSYQVEPMAIEWHGEDSIEVTVVRREYWGRTGDVHLRRWGDVTPYLDVVDSVATDSVR